MYLRMDMTNIIVVNISTINLDIFDSFWEDVFSSNWTNKMANIICNCFFNIDYEKDW